MADKVKIIGAVLLCVAFSSSALTLGRVRGAALVGQPLDMVIPVQMEAGEDASSLCFEADVFHADTRQDASRVRVRIETTAQPNTALVRVLSASVVDEPVVTIYLRTGCGQKTTRRYVLLADLPSEVAAPPVPRVPLLPAPSLASATASPAAPAAVVKARSPRVPRIKVQPDVDSPTPVRARPQSVEKSKAVRPAGQSRLKLDPLELLSDRVANLDSFMNFEPPEDALRSMQRIQTLEGAVKAGLALAAKNDASLADLKARLQKAESERTPVGLLYGLMALVLVCLAALAFLWHRQRSVPAHGSDWWKDSATENDTVVPEHERVAAVKPAPASTDKELPVARAADKASRPALSAMSELSSLSSSASNVDVNLTEMSESTFGDFMLSEDVQSDSLQAPPVLLANILPRSGTNFNSDAILDVRQQADFFVSLGQTDRAVRILKKKIEESEEPNPFYYLDLLEIFHSLSLKVDFQQFREDFNLLFAGQVPEFAFFKNEGKSLESYPDVLSHISALWPSPKVLTEIESCIFRDPGEGRSQAFDLAAFRDLLLLHSMAQSMVSAPDAGSYETRRAPPQGAATALPGALDVDLSDSKTQSAGTAFDNSLERMRQFSNSYLMEFNVPKTPNKG